MMSNVPSPGETDPLKRVTSPIPAGTTLAEKLGGRGKPAKKTTTKTKPKPKPIDLDEAVRRFYPQYVFLLDNPQLFGQDVIDTIRRATNENWTPERFSGAIQGTTYWQSTVASAKNFDAATEADKQSAIDAALQEINTVTEVGSLDKGVVMGFARDMARRGVSGENLKQLTYQFVFNQGVQTRAAQQALFSQSATEMRKVARQYGSVLGDDQIRNYLSSGKKAADLQVMYREKLKAQYPHLASQLDADLTFEDIVSDYRQIAAQTLERNPDSIDFTKPEFMEAIAVRDERGNVRQLSLGEWQQKLRTDDRYGYSKTNQAVREARTLAASLARAFGRI